jgi:hypothetical protein
LKISIDNHDGLGPLDYTGCLSGNSSLKLERTLNMPAVCSMLLDCNGQARAVPAIYGRVIATSDTGLVLFTGYVALLPAWELAGAGVTGLLYLHSVTAISDEILLDLQGVPVTSASTGLSLAQMMQMLKSLVDPTRITIAAGNTSRIVGQFTPMPEESWSANAGVLSSMARAGYRVINQQLSVLAIGTTTHFLSDTAGTLDLSQFAISQARSLANDVTVCGESEPQAYVTDVFQGDGTTTTFVLTHTPLRVSALKGAIVTDSFGGPGLNPQIWQENDPGSRFSFTSAGLTVNGGNGLDGQTTVTAINNVEMGGALVLTVGGVIAAAGSSGYLGCFYNGSVLFLNLFAGFAVSQSGGNTIVTPILNGVATGTPSTLVTGHAYSFRLRYHCNEMQRVMATYYVDGGSGEQAYGGNPVAASAQLVFEVQDTTAGTNLPTMVLYDGSTAVSPTTCVLCAVNSLAFTGSVQSVVLEQTGTAWVCSLQTTGSAFSRRLGLATIGSDCKLETTRKLVFYATSIPQVGELVTVSYRTTGKAVARLMNAASIAAETSAAVPGVSRWVGSVTSPVARSSADCENAALALLLVSTSPTAGWAGKYSAINVQQGGSTADIWPGDEFAIQSVALGLMANLVVRTVAITYENWQPETLTYSIAFANDWADAVSLKISNAVPKDVWLPQVAIAAPTALQSLTSLTAKVGTMQIVINAGMTAPPGGGFEVRRIDWLFGPGNDGTLVLRSPVANFDILREAAVEQYYIRMYDGSIPPNYSRFSSAVCASVLL